QNPRIAFVNLAGDSCAAIAAEDRASLDELFRGNVQAATDLVACDVLFLYCNFDPRGKVIGAAKPLRGLIRESGARVVVIASDTPTGLFTDAEVQKEIHQGDNPPVNLVITYQRHGENFGRFFKSLFQQMWTGTPMGFAWIVLSPQGNLPPDETLPGT